MDEKALYLFNIGENAYAYRALGAHRTELCGVEGWSFAVFAPRASAVSVVGDFNNWDRHAHPMQSCGETGVWELFIGCLERGERYKFAVTDAGGATILKADPFAFRSELRPQTASLLWDIPSFGWTDAEYLLKRAGCNPFNRPMSIYEVHLSSWKTELSPEELSEQLVGYCKDMGYTHIELLPVCEHPLDESWGYQVTGYFAVSARYGEPEQLMALVNRAHAAGIGVIMDWVGAHFTKDEHGLARFDGQPLFEPAEPLRAQMPQWGTLLFDYSRAEVRSFLISNAVFFLKEFHMDGLRADAVSCMLYHDFCREQWLPNRFGGRENLEAIEFIRQLNTVVHRECGGALMIAEESSSFPGVTKPVCANGLGFDFKWNMGYMNDTLGYFEKDSVYRKYHHSLLTFPMTYAFSEKYILPFSHDEMVHGKRSLIGRMQGSYENRFEQLRLLFAYQFAHPGKKLMFMGSEIGQFIEWNLKRPIDWFLLEYPQHRAMAQYVRALNKFYAAAPALHREDTAWEGYQWVCTDDAEHSVIAFCRKNGASRLLIALNFTPVRREGYRLELPREENAPASKVRCVFSTHGGERPVKEACPTREGGRAIEVTLYGYEGAFYEF